ncbi:hypothetical protein Tco_1028452 [Tanacetum coccineum]|uniref:Uncharacterized protein n=1 Tax=Tanacetum coccineum TaxID=301880 RepID=A0ABQ5G0L2_9ASTR
MRSDEIYNFCDGTLTSVRRVLHDIANNLRMDYLPKRRWSNLDRKRSRIMIKAIDQQLFERRLMRNLEKFGLSLVFSFHDPPDWRDLSRDIPIVRLEVLRFNTSAGNPTKEILLKLNLPDHRSILTDSKVTPTKHRRNDKADSSPNLIANCFIADSLKDGHGGTQLTQRFIAICSNSTDKSKDIMKA